MPIVNLAPDPLNGTQFIPGGNTPAAGGQLFCYRAGSTTKQAMYTDISGTTQWTNPIVLDSGGNLGGSNEIWIPAGLPAKFVLAPSNDTDPPVSPYWSRDNISGVNDAGSILTEWIPSGLTPTFLNASSFILGGDQTSIFAIGRRLKTVNTAGTLYSTVTSASFGTSTTIGLASDTLGLDAGVSSIAYGILNTRNTSLPETVNVLNYGMGTPTQNAASLMKALVAYTNVVVPAGTYDNVIVSTSGRTLKFDRGVTFRLPDNTVSLGMTSGPAVVRVTGSSVTFAGDFTIDGNSAANNSTSFPTTDLTGSFHVNGDNCRVEGKLTINTPYWRGFTVENGNNSGNEVDGFYADTIRIVSSVSYSALLWTAKNFQLNRIEVAKGSVPDVRVRIGTQTTNTGQAKNGYIGAIECDSAVGFESGSFKVDVGSIHTGVFKFQDASDCTVGSVITDYSVFTPSQVDAISFAYINARRCMVDTALVLNHNSSSQVAADFSPVTSCTVGSLIVSGTSSNVFDCRIKTADGLAIGSMILRSPLGTGGGFIFDTDLTNAFDPQKNIVIGSLISNGHIGADVTLESSTSHTQRINIGYINPDAVIATGGGSQPIGTFAWSASTNAFVVQTGFATVTSPVHVMPLDSPAAAIMASTGIFVISSSGAFTVKTSGGASTATVSNWNYQVIQPWVASS